VGRVTRISLIAAATLAFCATALPAATTGWVRVQHPALRGGASVIYLNDILPPDGSGHPWLLVGYLVDTDGNREPSAWTSEDGAAWTRTTMAPSASSERRDGPFYVARRGSVAAALGDRFENGLRPAAWYSTSPGTWSAITTPSDPLLAFTGRIVALDSGPNGFVAIGLLYIGGYSQVDVFTSSDGRSWVRRGAIEPSEGMRPLGVSAASGRVVIVGDSAFGSEPDARVWVFNEDGTWSRVDPASLGVSAYSESIITSVAWKPATGFVAGGSVIRAGHEIPTVWTSPDGLTWTRLPEGTPPSSGGNAAIQRMFAVPEGFLASGASDAGPRVWRSPDGKSWSAVSPPSSTTSAAQYVVAGAAGQKIVLLARSDSGSQLFRGSGAGWTRADTGSAFPHSNAAAELRDVAASGKRVVAVGQDGAEHPLVMLSSAGGSWHRAPFADRKARLIAITADRGVFWAAGWRLVAGRARLAVWTSRTGTNWRLHGGTAFEPVGAFTDVTLAPGGVAAVALEPSRRGFVTSAWTLTSAGWRDEGVLGAGEPAAVCAGPNGVTAVATVGGGLATRTVAWTHASGRAWPAEAELVAGSGASGRRCADTASGTVVVGQDQAGGATVWRRPHRGDPWSAFVLAQTAPESSIDDVVRDGAGFLATGTFGGRGQDDLAVWRSADGRGWSWLGNQDPVFTEAGLQSGQGIARLGERIVVVGRQGAGNAGLWVGPVPQPGGTPPP
jgi:hypothetical protein